MIDLSNIKKIYVYQKKVDLRYGINKLSILAQELVALSNMKHTNFLYLDQDISIWIHTMRNTLGCSRLTFVIE